MEYAGDAFHTFMDLDSVNLLGSQWDSHKPPVFHPKIVLNYLKLCSEDEWSFYGFGTTWG